MPTVGTPQTGTAVATDTVNLATDVTIAGADRLLIAVVAFNNNGIETVSSVTLDPTGTPLALTFLAQATQSNDSRIELWYRIAPPLGTFDVEAVLDGSLGGTEGLTLAAVNITDVRQITPFGTAVTNVGDTNPLEVTGIVSAVGDLATGFATREGAGTVTLDAGTEIWNFIIGSGGEEARNAGATKPGAASVDFSWTMSANNDWAAIGVSVFAAPIVVTGRVPDLRLLGVGQ